MTSFAVKINREAAGSDQDRARQEAGEENEFAAKFPNVEIELRAGGALPSRMRWA